MRFQMEQKTEEKKLWTARESMILLHQERD